MTSRLRAKRVFGERTAKSESKDPKSIYVISIAGEGKTEERYFNGLKEYCNLGTLYIEPLEKEREDDTKSHPKYVLEMLEEREKRWEEYGVDPNELWMVVDRDKQNVSGEQLSEIIKDCDRKGYNLALSNPTFELWLLLHLRRADEYDKNKLLKNEKVNKKRRFIEKELSDILDKGYNKRNFNFKDFQSGIKDAVERGKILPTNNKELIEELGTTVCLLVDKFLVQE